MPDAKLPPPLPPRPLVPEPFRLADTPPQGVQVLDPDPRDGMIRALQHDLALLQGQLSQTPTNDTPVPETRPSVRARRAALIKGAGKYGGLVVVALPVVGFVARAIARKHPQYQELIDQALDWLGL